METKTQRTKLTPREILDRGRRVTREVYAKAAAEEIYDRFKSVYPDYFIKPDERGYVYSISKTISIVRRTWRGPILENKEKYLIRIDGIEIEVHVNDSELVKFCEETVKTPDLEDRRLIVKLNFEDEEY